MRPSKTAVATFHALQAHGPATIPQLAQLLGITRDAAIIRMQRLDALGLVDRERGPGRYKGSADGGWMWTAKPIVLPPWTKAPRKPRPSKSGRRRAFKGRAKTKYPSERLMGDWKPKQIRERGSLPASVAQKTGLAGLVAQLGVK